MHALTVNDRNAHNNNMRHALPQVSRASPEALLARQRLVLTLERTSGSVVELAPGSCAGVFGWDPQLLLGRPLTDLLDVFEEWEGANGQGSSVMLLQGLAERCAGAADGCRARNRVAAARVLCMQGHRDALHGLSRHQCSRRQCTRCQCMRSAAAHEGESWRVGVKRQKEAPAGGAKAAAAPAGPDASRGWGGIVAAKLKSSRDAGRVVAARLQVRQCCAALACKRGGKGCWQGASGQLRASCILRAQTCCCSAQVLVDAVDDGDSAGRLSIALWRSDLLSGGLTMGCAPAGACDAAYALSLLSLSLSPSLCLSHTGVVEVDQDLRVTKADTPSLLLLGAPTGSMAKQPLGRCAHAPAAAGALECCLCMLANRAAAC